jgi:hypothetical protein
MCPCDVVMLEEQRIAVVVMQEGTQGTGGAVEVLTR